MAIDADIFERTEAFRRVGILVCGTILTSLNIRHPGDQMIIICEFLCREADFVSLPRSKSRLWAEAGLSAATRWWLRADKPGGSWIATLERSAEAVLWRPELEFGNLIATNHGGPAFQRAAKQLRLRGIDVSWDRLVDLRDDFTAGYLPQAVRSFDPERGAGHEVSWLSQVFYRYALKSIFADRVNQEQLRVLSSTSSRSETPEDTLIWTERDRAMSGVLETMDQLPEVYRTVLRMYFGFDDREATLSEIGRTVGVTRFKARGLVVSGLARLTFKTGLRDRFSEAELTFAQKLFRDGMPPSEAARQMGMSAVKLARGMNRTFEVALRPRTKRDKNQILVEAPNMSDETDLPQQHGDLPGAVIDEATQRYVNELLESVSEQPQLLPGARGNLVVALGSFDVDFDVIRKAVSLRTIDRLIAKGINMDWLLSGPAPSQDREVEATLNEELEAIENRRWTTASALFELCESRLGRALAADDERSVVIRKICMTLIATAQDLDARLPPEGLMAGGAKLEVVGSREFSNQGVNEEEIGSSVEVGAASKEGAAGSPYRPTVGWWEFCGEASAFDIAEVVGYEAEFAGELDPPVAQVLGREVAQQLLNGEIRLDGITFESITERGCVYTRRWKTMEMD